MKINIVHPSLNRCGGAEYVCLEAIKAFRESDFEVELYTIDKVDWLKLKTQLGKTGPQCSENYFFERLPHTRSSFLNWCTWAFSYILLLLKAQRSRGSITINNYGDVFPVITDLSYVHSLPLFCMFGYREYNPYRVPLWKLTSFLYFLLYSLLIRFRNCGCIIANSTFIAHIIERSTNKKPIVIHPPVRSPATELQFTSKRDTVLTVSRLKHAKNLHILTVIASMTGVHQKFQLMGNSDPDSASVIEAIIKNSRKYNVSDRLEIFVDPTRDMIDTAFSRSSIFLATQPTEAFGIAVVEAMARGCVPLVPRKGGPWIDVLERKQGKYGYAYSSAEEAAQLITSILSDDELRLRVAKRAIKRAQYFESNRFRLRIRRLISRIMTSSNLHQ